MLALIALGVALLAPIRKEWRVDTWVVWRDNYAWLFDHAPVFGWAPTEWLAIALGGAGVRLLLILLAAAMTLALLILVPRGHSMITVWGTRTLYVYLLHGLVVMGLRSSGAVAWFGEFGETGVLMLVALGIAITMLLSMRWITKLFRPVIEPKIDWIFGNTDELGAKK